MSQGIWSEIYWKKHDWNEWNVEIMLRQQILIDFDQELYQVWW